MDIDVFILCLLGERRFLVGHRVLIDDLEAGLQRLALLLGTPLILFDSWSLGGPALFTRIVMGIVPYGQLIQHSLINFKFILILGQ